MLIEVVIAKYNENVDWVSKLKYDVIIYDKSDNPIENSIHRPNIGREAETLLYHIITTYDKLPDLTIFLQGDPRSNPVKYTYEEVINEINKDHEEILKPILTWVGNTNMEDYWLKKCLILNKKFFDTDNNVIYSSGAQYVIPKFNILHRPKKFYQYLHNEIIKYGDKGLEPNNINLEDGIDAWTMELLWGKIFDINVKLKYYDL
jgi:hypothetical protein